MTLQLLVPVITYQPGKSATLAGNVAAIARYLAADVHAVVNVPDFPPVASALGTMLIDVPSMVRDLRQDCRKGAQALLAALGRDLGAAGITLRTTDAECFPPEFGDVVADHARYHDLVAIDLGMSEMAPDVAQAVVFGAGRPALLVSGNVTKIDFGHVMIAWDGTRAAARAVGDARIFLERAARVTVATVTEEKELAGSDLNRRLADYLARRGIAAQTVDIPGGRFNPVARLLQDKAKQIGAGLLVMGGFGHSRMRDFVLGGATNGILADLQVPALLSH